MSDGRWTQINAVGYGIETALARITAVALLVVVLVLVLRTEWVLLPEAAQEEVVCSEELSATAARALVHVELLVPRPPEEDQEGWIEQCRMLAASAAADQPREASPSLRTDWWLPLAVPDAEGEEP